MCAPVATALREDTTRKQMNAMITHMVEADGRREAALV